ncbi:MAG TPA: hypothetical protein VGE69_11670 [Pseudomonadales bacterium]
MEKRLEAALFGAFSIYERMFSYRIFGVNMMHVPFYRVTIAREIDLDGTEDESSA